MDEEMTLIRNVRVGKLRLANWRVSDSYPLNHSL